MPSPEDTLNKLERMWKLAEESLSRREFEAAYKAIIALGRALQKENETEFHHIHQAVRSLAADLKKQNTQTTKAQRDELKTFMAASGRKVDERLAKVRDGYTPKKGVDYFDGEDGEDGDDGSPDTPEEVVAKVNRSKTRIKASAIEGLEGKLQELSDRPSGRIQTPAKAYRIHTADASSQANGVNKAFSVGGTHFGIITVAGTQFPNIYRPIIDYTLTPTGILLTAAVSAPEAGQTLVITFLK